jgi:hypothetical protein
MVNATLRSKAGLDCALKAHAVVGVSCNGKAVQLRNLGGGVVEFSTVKDGVYEVTAIR